MKASAQVPPPSSLVQQDWIAECYRRRTVTEIFDSLRGHDTKAGNVAADLIATRSPIALAVTLDAVRRASALDTLEDVLVQEYRTSCALNSHDFVEGIRAQVIDKDRNPQWSPSSLEAVTADAVEEYFEPDDRELTFGDLVHDL